MIEQLLLVLGDGALPTTVELDSDMTVVTGLFVE